MKSTFALRGRRLMTVLLCAAVCCLRAAPNFFVHANTELSQDAMLAWCAEWADDANRSSPLHAMGRDLLSLLAGEAVSPKKVQVLRQYRRIDVLCVLDKDTAILIEDKAGSSEHDHQLERYLALLKKEGTYKRIVPVYVQTRDQADYSGVKAAGYRIVLREDLQRTLEPYRGKSPFVEDFCAFMQQLGDEYAGFRTMPHERWTDRTWQGYFKELQRLMGPGSRRTYVPSPQGGFQAFIWCELKPARNIDIWLQLEEHQVSVKLRADRRLTTDICNLWSARVVAGGTFVRPKRLRAGGRTATIGDWPHPYRTGTPEEVADRLRMLEKELRKALGE